MVDHAALASVLDEFAATVTGEFSAEDILAQLARAAIRVLGVDGAGVMAPAGERLLRFVYASAGPAAEVERLQEVLQTGPCGDAHASGQVVNVADLTVEGNWPTYQTRAVELGLRAVAAVPLLARGRSWGVLDVYRAEPGRLAPAELAAARTLANLATSYLVVTADRDDARSAQRQLAYRAMHDPLTGLPVRWVFLEQLNHALARLDRHPGQVAVLFCDLDGLKYVNDTYGHAAGDRLLATCAQRVRAALRPADVLARIGGDELVVLLEDITPAGAENVAERILNHLAVAYRPDGDVIQPSASVGVAVTADPTTTADTLISHADAAMYRAKHAGRGRYRMFDPGSYAASRAGSTARDDLTAALRTALADGQLELHYQPIIDLTGPTPPGCDGGGSPGPAGTTAAHRPAGAVWAVEALLRWRHPLRGLLTASEFIDAAERSDLIGDLGAWVLATACTQLVAWDTQLARRSPGRMFVNISAAELTAPDLAGHVAAALAAAGLDPSRLTLEITETGLFSDPQTAAAAVAALRRIGCQLAIDDFGTGYSSLSRLVHIPAATLKTDRSFTHSLTTSPDDAAVVSAVLQLGRTLHRTVIVEGVEDAPTLSALRTLGATHAQGIHLAPPQHPDTLTAQLAR